MKKKPENLSAAPRETLLRASREAISEIIEGFGPHGETGFITHTNENGDKIILWGETNGTEHLTIEQAA